MSDPDVWQDVEASGEGLSIVTYSQHEHCEPVVEDESWWTWAEIEQMRQDND
jgi:hypothetical protein